VAALRRALHEDPDFAVAAADLAALRGEETGVPTGAVNVWERHHVEVVLAAARGHSCRAVDLLREHLSAVGCDPVATAIVAGAAGVEPLDDLRRGLPGCHRQGAPGGP
jgi:hypothetical protein